jgi:hypothetical protein
MCPPQPSLPISLYPLWGSDAKRLRCITRHPATSVIAALAVVSTLRRFGERARRCTDCTGVRSRECGQLEGNREGCYAVV